jgi:high affinity Mn2+ porin
MQRSDGLVSCVTGRRQDYDNDEGGSSNLRAGNILSMNRRTGSWKRVAAGLGLGLFGFEGSVAAADLPLNAPAPAADFSWTGFYIGGNVGAATGKTNWTATEAGAAVPTLNGSINLFNTFDAFEGTGSYFIGLQAGYNYMLPSRILLGVEADFAAPNTLAGTQTISSALIGQASYNDTVLDFGSARGRIGYAFDHWMVYGTGGVAWTYDKLTRTQLAGMPAGGSADVGTS